jgi:hypothetical protein
MIKIQRIAKGRGIPLYKGYNNNNNNNSMEQSP